MRDDKGFGLATLKIEGELQDYETGRIATAEERAAYEQRHPQQLLGMQKFEQSMQQLDGVIVTPSWIIDQLAIVERLDNRNAAEATSYLKSLVLYHIAQCAIADPSACAKEIATRPDQFSWGW